ncbi:MAG: TraR/DksA C4-type zinc finger protein [Gaiellaceae bacterium]
MAEIESDRFRSKLLEERRRVLEAIDYLHEENPGSIEDETAEIVGSSDNHLAETATVTVDREIDYTLEDNSLHVLRAIDAALKRIDEGTYGTCERCGRPVEPDRLEMLPYATLCIEDKRREERG